MGRRRPNLCVFAVPALGGLHAAAWPAGARRGRPGARAWAPWGAVRVRAAATARSRRFRFPSPSPRVAGCGAWVGSGGRGPARFPKGGLSPLACRGPSPPARRGRRLSSAARWRVVERRRVSAVGGLLDGGFVSGFESLLVRLLPQVVSDEAVRVPVGVADFDGPGAARDGLVVGGEPFEPAVLVDEREPALASVREVGLSGLPCEYRVAAVGRVSAARVRVGDAVVGR